MAGLPLSSDEMEEIIEWKEEGGIAMAEQNYAMIASEYAKVLIGRIEATVGDATGSVPSERALERPEEEKTESPRTKEHICKEQLQSD